MQNIIFLPFAIVLFFLFRMMFKRAVFYHAGRKEWITDIRWYHYTMYYALMAFFTGCLLIPFFPETVMQIGRFYDLHHGRAFVSVQGDNDKELHELRKGLPDREEMFKYEVLSSVTPTEIVDKIIPETIEYQRKLKQMWVDMGVYSAVQYDFDKEFEIHYDIDNKNYYILADGKKFADIVRSITFIRPYSFGVSVSSEKEDQNAMKDGADYLGLAVVSAVIAQRDIKKAAAEIKELFNIPNL